MKLPLRVTIPAIIACLLWSSSFVFVKIGLQHMPPLTLAGFRFLLAGMMLIPFSGNLRHLASGTVANFRHVFIVSFFSTILHYSLFFWGMVLVPGAQGAIIVGSSPLLTALLAHVLVPDDRLSLRKLLIIGLGLLGVVLVALSSHPWQAVGLREFGGMVLLVLCESSFVLGNIAVLRKMHTSLPPIALNSVQMILGGAMLLVMAWGIEGIPHLSVHPALWGALSVMSFISAVAFSIWFILLQSVKVSQLSIWMFLIPVFGATLSWIFLPGESPDAFSILGMAVICVAIVLFYTQKELPREEKIAVEA